MLNDKSTVSSFLDLGIYYSIGFFYWPEGQGRVGHGSGGIYPRLQPRLEPPLRAKRTSANVFITYTLKAIEMMSYKDTWDRNII